jgi:hypothetical protein
VKFVVGSNLKMVEAHIMMTMLHLYQVTLGYGPVSELTSLQNGSCLISNRSAVLGEDCLSRLVARKTSQHAIIVAKVLELQYIRGLHCRKWDIYTNYQTSLLSEKVKLVVISKSNILLITGQAVRVPQMTNNPRSLEASYQTHPGSRLQPGFMRSNDH